MSEERSDELMAAAARQQGLVTAAQAARLGVDTATLGRFSDAGLLDELDWAVYQLAGGTLGPRYAYPYAAWLAISPERFAWERPATPVDDAVLSHESAAALHGIGALPVPFMVFTAPLPAEPPRATTIHTARLAPDQVVVDHGVPVTTPLRTILDLVRAPVGHADVGRAITDALVKDLVDVRALHAAMVPLAAGHRFPSDRAEFLRYFAPDLPPASP